MHFPVSVDSQEDHMPPSAGSGTRLQGWLLTIVRVAWVILALLGIATFVALIPLSLRGYMDEWQVRNAASALEPFIQRDVFGAYVLVIRYIAASAFFLVGAVIFWRKSSDWMAVSVALTLMLLPLTFNLSGFSDSVWMYAWPWDVAVRVARDVLVVFGVTGFIGLLYVFPDGQFRPRWMGVGAVVLGGLNLAIAASSAFGEQISWVWPWGMLAEFILLVAGVASQGYRYMRVSSTGQRQQTRWVLLGMAVIIVWAIAGAMGVALNELGGNSAWYDLVSIHLQVLIVMIVPLTIALSVLRHRLWNIDLVVNRALVYGVLTAVVVGLYVLVVGGLSTLLLLRDNLFVTVLFTGLVALLVQPLRARLQWAINRLMYGERDDPATVLARLGGRIETSTAPGALLPAIVDTIAQALRLPYVGIVVPDGDATRVVAAHGQAVARMFDLPLTYQGEVVGSLQAGPRAPGEDLTPADLRLLHSIASQTGAVVHAVRLTADLQHSRVRLVNAREEERRRLRRDLHDGLGPMLASQTLKLDAVIDLLDTDPTAARVVTLDLKKQTQSMIADIRRLVYELRPPALDELGLLSAVHEHVTHYAGAVKGLQVSVQSPPAGLPPLRAAVEVAAYRIVQEAVTNVVRHASAHACTISFTLDTDLCIEIVDDGIGMPVDVTAGVGLASIRERTAELDGTCVIKGAPNGGTRIIVTLPV
jgi:signal transduction histidine kinase